MRKSTAILTTLLAALLTACGSSNQPDVNAEAAAICQPHNGIALVQYNETKKQHEVMCSDGHFEAVSG